MKTLHYAAQISLIFSLFSIFVPQSAFAQQTLSVYCQANPSAGNSNTNIVYTAYASGGYGNYSYLWSGSDNLSGTGQSISHTYPYVSGRQEAQVVVFSQGLSQTAYCYSDITLSGYNNYNPNYNNLTAYCYANPSTVNIGDSVNWIGSATGGNGGYSYSWSGTDNITGTNDIIVRSYQTGGQKSATFTVYSNGQSASATCLTNVNWNGSQNANIYLNQYPQYPTYGNPSGGVFLSQVPYTGSSTSVVLYVLTLFLWSVFGAYLMVLKKKTAIVTIKK